MTSPLTEVEPRLTQPSGSGRDLSEGSDEQTGPIEIVEVARAGDLKRRALADVLGIDGHTGVEPFLDVVAAPGTPRLTPVLLLAGVAAAPAAAIALLGPALVVGLGGDGALLAHLTAAFLLGTAWGGAIAPVLQSSSMYRATANVLAAALIGWGALAAAGGSPVGGLAVAGLGSGLAGATLPVWVAERFHVAVRLRVLATYRIAGAVGVVVYALLTANLVVAGITAVAAPLILLAVLALIAAVVVRRTALQPPGEADVAELCSLIGADPSTSKRVGLLASFRSVLRVPSERWLLAGYAAVGIAFAAVHTEVIALLAVNFSLDGWVRGAVYAGCALAAIALIGFVGAGHESRYRSNPARLVSAAAAAIAAAGVALAALAWWPWLGGLAFLLVAVALSAGALVALDGATLTAVRPVLRSSALALATAAFGAAGALAAYVLLAVDASGGVRPALSTAAVAMVAGGLLVRRARACMKPDVEAAINREIEQAELSVAVMRQLDVPLLSCRNIDFSYGAVRVLFDVSFAVDDGEMVALLGTNGAGKSTLLRAISGLGHPTGGTIRFNGEDITYLDPAQRVRLGISQVPGGKAAFGPLSVVDNLRVYGYTLGRNRRAVDAGIDAAFETFPRLAERRNMPAQVLSGGERQMLALTKALILKPQLLLIDELSLGLAPAVVGQLLEMVRTINSGGTSVVLVEQSVNVALTLVHHAFYMEKGEVRFDGRAEQLLERPDVLRSVYLEGAAKGMSS